MIRRLGLALVVAGLTALAVAGRVDDGLTRLVIVLHSVMGVVALVVSVLSRRRLRRALDRIRAVKPVVATGLIDPPGDDVARLIAEVRGLGFELAGATDTVLLERPVRTWILLAEAGDAWVEVGMAQQPMAIFLSQAANGRLIETAYPVGENIDDPRLLAHAVSSGVAEAIAEHRAAVAAAGGRGRRVTTLDDYLAAERDQRAQTGGMRIRAYLERVVEPSIRDWTISVAVDGIALLVLALAGGIRAPG